MQGMYWLDLLLMLASVSPFGWVQLKLAEKANLEIANSKPSPDLTEGKGNQRWPFSLCFGSINLADTRTGLH
ncbi:hypothetical protein BS78_03G117400 [Paspalum vaginatum]|nr:hypothetical protein BS78_03G117400 [Paspalum vaginatum]